MRGRPNIIEAIRLRLSSDRRYVAVKELKNEIASTGNKQAAVGGKESEMDLEFSSTCANLPRGGVV